MSGVIKIKTFNHFNDEIINEFLKQTEGKIVNYNPIVIEYNESKSFVDPFLGKASKNWRHVSETELASTK